MAEIIDIRDLMERQEAKRVTKLEFEARKIYLESYMSIVRELEDLQMEREELRYAIGPGSGCGNGMPKGSRVSDGSDRIINRMERMGKLESIIDREERALIRRRDEIAQVMDSVSNGPQREVLRKRYVMDMDISTIAIKMNYSIRQVQYIHKRAIVRMKVPARALVHIKGDLLAEHPEWANDQVKTA